MVGPLSDQIPLFLDPPQPVCIGCTFIVGRYYSLRPTTVYEISKGGVTTPLDGMEGVTVNDNGTLFVEDASAVFAEGDSLICTYGSGTTIFPVLALSRHVCRCVILITTSIRSSYSQSIKNSSNY